MTMLSVKKTKQFKHDYRLMKRRGKELEKLRIVLEFLVQSQPLPEEYKDHSLLGGYKGCRECHIEPDWLLIYMAGDKVLKLMRAGTHSDLFG